METVVQSVLILILMILVILLMSEIGRLQGSFSKNGFLKHFKELEEIATETFPRGQKDNKYGL